MKVRRVDLANWARRTTTKFTTGVKYQFHQGFYQIRDPEIPMVIITIITTIIIIIIIIIFF